MRPKPDNFLRYAHHRKAIRTVLDHMVSFGHSIADCLENTGLTESDIDNDELLITLEKEHLFYRNVLKLSNSTTVGLLLGKAFRIETYGLLGYALLSSETVADAIQTTADFSPLTFSHFKIDKIEGRHSSGIAFEPQSPLPQDLIQLYSDLDTSAAMTALQTIIPGEKNLAGVRLIHDDEQNRQIYEQFFNCPIEFSCPQNELLIDNKYALKQLPRRDKQATDYCRIQCQQLLSRLDDSEATADKVRAILVANPGFFPSIETVAKELDLGVRTLRRMLLKENTCFQELLQEIRRELAEEYLLSNMTLETIASKLGYSEAANFSHAFKRWNGMSPKTYRKINL